MDENKDSCSSSDSNPCPICLGPFVQDSYLDRCFHKFCYNCILRWAKVVAYKFCYNCILRWAKVVACKNSPQSSVKCPLCKTESFSIIHGYDGNSFQQYYINQGSQNSDFFSKAHNYRLKCYYSKPGTLTDKFNVSQFWKSHKYLQPNRWLFSWSRREIQALIQEEDVDIIVHHVLGVIDSLRRNEQKHPGNAPKEKQEEFKALVSEAVRPFLIGRTDQFVNEVELFLASGLNIEAYDKVYIQHLGWKVSEETIDEEEEEFHDHTPLVSYLYFFDDDSDGTD